MKNYRLLTFVFLFTGFLLQGFWFGRKLGNQIQVAQGTDKDQAKITYRHSNELINTPEDPLSHMITPPVPSTSATDDHEGIIHQRNLLVIGVDDLDSDSPSLKSVWLIIFMPNTPHFMLLPIYPNSSFSGNNQLSISANLSGAFQLDRHKTPRDSFFKAIKAKDIWWNGYILLDETALIEVNDFVGRISQINSSNIINTLKNVPDPDDDPLGSLLGQAQIVQSLCSQTLHLSTVDKRQYLKLLEKVREHIRSDLDFDTTITDWQQLITYSGNISCEFPSLAAPNFNP